jgi:hypothetical protein
MNEIFQFVCLIDDFMVSKWNFMFCQCNIVLFNNITKKYKIFNLRYLCAHEATD